MLLHDQLDDPLEALDQDPLVAARGVADGILSYAGLVPSPVGEYRETARELREAVAAFSPENEAVLQELLERKPWILLHRAEYDSVLPRPRLSFSEKLEDGKELERRIEPDFVYQMPDSESLVVEIESAEKRLLTTKQETGYNKPAAPASAAAFQIGNYRRLFDGFAGAQLRRGLAVPDAWSFRFLLVVGAESQADFDRRSWVNVREHFGASGIAVRTWDYYIHLMERRAEAADFKGPGAE